MPRFLRTGLWVGAFALAGVTGFCLRERRLDLLGPAVGPVVVFGDQANGGHSTLSLRVEGSLWRASVHLSPGFAYPYAGWGVRLDRGPAPGGRDGGGFDSLLLEVRARHQRSLRIQLSSFDSGQTDTARPLSYVPFEGAVGVGSSWTRTSIALRDLATPLWWDQVNGTAPRARPDWRKHLASLTLISWTDSPRSWVDTVEVRRLELGGTRWTPLALCLLAVLVGCVGWEGRNWFSSRNQVGESVLPAAKPVELLDRKNVEREALLSWIAGHYMDPQLTVEWAGRETGIHPRRVAGILREAVGRTFPAHVNELRLSEAARLLRGTDRTVAEVASAVGFSNVPHFHRLFKTRFGKPPGEWREGAVDLDPPRV